MIGLDSLVRKLALLGRKHRRATVAIGFSAPYAAYVHEDLQARHRVGGAKFLERAVASQKRIAAGVVLGSMRNGAMFEEALLAGAEVILARAQLLCPVDTGALHDSGYARVEDDAG